MAEVQNVGAVDYAQYQPSQYAEPAYNAEYPVEPEVYDERAEQMKMASKSRNGAMAVTALAIAGLALWGGHKWGKNSASKEIEKAKDAVANYEKAKKAMEDAEKAAEEGNQKWFGENHCGNKLFQKIKDLFKPFKNAAEDAKDGAEKAAEDAKDAAEELAEKATDANK